MIERIRNYYWIWKIRRILKNIPDDEAVKVFAKAMIGIYIDDIIKKEINKELKKVKED